MCNAQQITLKLKLYDQERFLPVKWLKQKLQTVNLSVKHDVASPAMGYRGTCPLDFQQFHFNSLWSKSESQLLKYCAVCESTLALSISAALVTNYRAAAAPGSEVHCERPMT